MVKPTSKQIVLITSIVMTPLFLFFLLSQFHLSERQELVLQIDANSLQWEELSEQVKELQALQLELQTKNSELRASPVFTIAE